MILFLNDLRKLWVRRWFRSFIAEIGFLGTWYGFWDVTGFWFCFLCSIYWM